MNLSKHEQDRELLLAALKVNPWSPSLYAKIPHAWKAVVREVRPKFMCYETYVRQRVAYLLNKYESTRKERPGQSVEADDTESHQQQQGQQLSEKNDQQQPQGEQPQGEQLKEEESKDSEENASMEKAPQDRKTGDDVLTFEELLEKACDKRQVEEDRIMEDWMKLMLRKHTRRSARAGKEREKTKNMLPPLRPPLPALQCPVCKVSFSEGEEAAALMHFAGHLDDCPNRCRECRQSFSSRHEFAQHLRVHVIRPSMYKNQQCDVCGEVFQGSMKAHLLKHGVNTYNTKTCGVCGYTTRKASVLTKHLRTHSGEKLFLCDLCPKAYTTSVYLKEHKLAIHEREAKHYCDMCTKSFYTQLRLRRHIKTHFGEKPFSCDQCGRGFTTAYNLRTHQRLHTGVKPYKCKLCEAAFVQKTSLDCHLKKHGIVMHRRPRSCDTGPDRQDQTEFLTKNHPSQFFEGFKDTWPGRPKPVATTSMPSPPKAQPEDTTQALPREAHSWPRKPTGPAPREDDMWGSRKVLGSSSREEDMWGGRKALGTSSREEDMWGDRKALGTSSREEDMWGDRKALGTSSREEYMWGDRKALGTSSREEDMWGGRKVAGSSAHDDNVLTGMMPHRPGAEPSPGPSWATPGLAKSSFGEPPREFPWLSLLTPRPHMTEDSQSSDPAPQDFSFSATHGYSRASQGAQTAGPKVPVFPSQGGDSDRNNLGSYPMVLHY
ncbi:zinc finger protein 892-like [Littorina saxatilis]|uniref:zinc finger protein 892-like n=1 Tax=Littorina saxatilis TaxID=31220 RepID=UPI0038B4B289